MGLADLEGARVEVRLDGMTEEMREQEEPQLGTHGIVDIDLRAIQIASQRVGDVSGYDANIVVSLDLFLHSGDVFFKRNHPCSAPSSATRHVASPRSSC